MKADVAVETPDEIKALQKGLKQGEKHYDNPIDEGIAAISALHAELYPVEAQEAIRAVAAKPAATPTTPEPASDAKMTGLEKAQQQRQDPPLTSESTQPITQKKPVSFHDLNQQDGDSAAATAPQEQVEAPAPVSPAVEKIKVDLDENVKNILSDAGADMKKNLFKSSDDNEPLDAAE